MLFIAAGVVILVALLLLALIVHRTYFLGGTDKRVLRNVDFAAFCSLIRPKDDLFLKANLPRKYYRMSKRARIRAIQQYLRWIASDCTTIQLLARASRSSTQDQEIRQKLCTLALRLRVTSILIWSCLWVERVLPDLNVLPGSVFDRYGAFVEEVRTGFVQSALIHT